MSAAVVQLHEVSPGVAQITMQDRTFKNGFSSELTAGLCESFARVGSDEACRVVVLTGYDNYFASGGTQQALLGLQAGQGKFTDTNLYMLPLSCPIPVVAAMQGHGIGGGFVFGLFADVIVLARERVYTTNFMKYGFTPGMGATCILPAKLGTALAHEMLLTARTYRGSELAERGAPFKVLPHAEVLAHAQGLAKEIAEKPRAALISLKSHLAAELRARLPQFAVREVELHALTFGMPEVKDRITTLFGK
jgi:polyketide biosynthesis enoyl-CoA hydratase PksI